MSTPPSIEEKPIGSGVHLDNYDERALEQDEVFKKTTDGVDFRTVGWPRASFIFLKVLFATGVLTIPSAMATLGAVGGALSLLGWGTLNTWAGIIGVSIALSVLSNDATCSVWFSLVSTVFIVAAASIRKFHDIAWLTWAGFASVFVAVFIIVVAVTTLDRPAAAPQTGDFDLGFYAFLSPDFAAGMVATCTIFISTAGTSAFIPVIAEMKQPKDYKKALFVAMAFVSASYLAFSLIVYKWCGKWVASPSLGVSREKLWLDVQCGADLTHRVVALS
ncbi:hypothetical protein PQX77_010818 [Marasmius sp. AFHP31]|nr:hypothetical protein PQX77_010818 [Marasmius sp. AFHP31]